MNTIEKNILEIAETAIEKNNCVLIEPVFRGERGSKVVQFFIDGEKDVTADLCAEISREIGDRLEEMPDAPSFRLEISSPGIDRPLKFLLQYPKHIGRKFEVEYTEDGEAKSLPENWSRLKSRIRSYSG